MSLTSKKFLNFETNITKSGTGDVYIIGLELYIFCANSALLPKCFPATHNETVPIYK